MNFLQTFEHNSKIIVFINLSFILIPAAIIIGPFLADLLVVLLGFFFLIYIFKYKEFHYLKNTIFIIFIIFCFYITLNSLINNGSFASIKSSIFYFRFGLLALSVQLLLDKKGSIVFKQFFFIMLIIYIVLGCDVLSEFFFKKNILNQFSVYPGRISSLFGDELIVGSYIYRMMPIFISSYVFFNIKNPKIDLYFMFFLIFLLYLVFISGERSAFILSLLFFFIIAWKIFIKKKYFFLIFFLSLIIFLISFLNFDSLKNRYYDKTISQFEISKDSFSFTIPGLIKIYPFEYQIYFSSSIHIWKTNLLFGRGNKSYRILCSKIKKKDIEGASKHCSIHPHNYYLQMLAENGLVGLIFLSSFFLYLFYKLVCLIFKKNYSAYKFVIVTGLFTFYWPLIYTGSYFNNVVSLFNFIILGFYFFKDSCERNV